MKIAVILALCFPLALQAEVSMMEAVENSPQVTLPSDVPGANSSSLRTFLVWGSITGDLTASYNYSDWWVANVCQARMHPDRQEGGEFRENVVLVPGQTDFTMVLRDRSLEGLDQFYVVAGPLTGVANHLHCHARTFRGVNCWYCPAIDNYVVPE